MSSMNNELWFKNMLVLGLDVLSYEKQYHIKISSDMFMRSNVKGMEVVLYFLLSKCEINSTTNIFRNVWPIFDNSQSREFRQIVCNLLQKYDKDGAFPPCVYRKSLITTASGDRFYNLLLYLTHYTMKIFCRHIKYHIPLIIDDKNDKNDKNDVIKLEDMNLMLDALKLHQSRQCQYFIQQAHESIRTDRIWTDQANLLTIEYHKLGKMLNNLEQSSLQYNQNKNGNESEDDTENSIDYEIKQLQEFYQCIFSIEKTTDNGKKLLSKLNKSTTTINSKDILDQLNLEHDESNIFNIDGIDVNELTDIWIDVLNKLQESTNQLVIGDKENINMLIPKVKDLFEKNQVSHKQTMNIESEIDILLPQYQIQVKQLHEDLVTKDENCKYDSNQTKLTLVPPTPALKKKTFQHRTLITRDQNIKPLNF